MTRLVKQCTWSDLWFHILRLLDALPSKSMERNITQATGRKPEQVFYAPNLFEFFFTQDDALDAVGGPRPAYRSRRDEVFIDGAGI